MLEKRICPSEQIAGRQRIFRIPHHYITHVGLDIYDPKTKMVTHRSLSGFDNIFEAHGFIIERGSYDAQNPNEIGMGVGPNNDDEVARNQEIAEAAGLPMPRQLTVAEVLQENIPVMAKVIGAHAGDGKYLLETTEQKAKFVTLQMFFDNIGGHIFFDPNSNLVIDPVFRSVVDGMITDATDGQTFAGRFLHYYTQYKRQRQLPVDTINVDELMDINRSIGGILFQQYIETPGLRPASLRILADAFGGIHYVALIHSPYDKNSQQLTTPLSQAPKNILRLKHELLDDYRGLFHVLYTQPTSPFYLGAHVATSYHDEQSEEIILAGQQIDNPVTRAVLTAHGINPDKAEIPLPLITIGQKLGRVFRGYAPFGGHDLIQDLNGNYYYLEGNDTPGLAPAGLDLPENTPYSDLEEAVITRMLAKLPEE